MKKTYYLLILMVASITVTSCSIEKRLHNKGFHVELNKRYKGGAEVEGEKNETAQIRTTEEYNTSKNEVADLNNSTDNYQDVAFDQDRSVEVSNSYVSDNSSIGSNTNQTVRTTEVSNENKEISKSSVRTELREKKVTPKSAPAEGKSQVTALVLVILLGVLGIHRFYLGHVGIGILMLLTAGCCGILALVDLIRIITGDLKPKDGEYAKKFGDK